MVKISPVHYLLPLPPGLHDESPELFGFYVYELRVGHTDRIWCTAQGRFGHPTASERRAAPGAAAEVPRGSHAGWHSRSPRSTRRRLFSGRNVTSKPPKTEIWCMLYAQVKQADAAQNRNILLAETRGRVCRAEASGRRYLPGSTIRHCRPQLANSLDVTLDAPATGKAQWSADEIQQLLDQFNLSRTTGLSVLAVEMMPRYDQYILFREGARHFGLSLVTAIGPVPDSANIAIRGCS